MDTFDLIVVGTGSGNAIPEELAGRRIALVERGVFGGTCLNVGCIPSKMLVLPADVAEAARHGGRLGVHATVERVDWPAIRDRVFGRIDPIAADGEDYRRNRTPALELIRGTARFVGRHRLEVDGRQLTAPHILVAIGSRPIVPDIPGLADVGYHTSDTVMRLERLPARLGILGGGFIAAELGHVFSGYGAEVTVFNRSSPMLRSEDADIAARFTEVFGRRVDLRLGAHPDRIERRGDVIVVHHVSGAVEVDELLVATGRRTNADLIDPEAGGLRCHDDGRIAVDDTMATSVDGVWAIGDVANDYQLKHLANAEAEVAFWNMAHPGVEPRRVDYRAVPHAVFGDPQIATVGHTEQQAADRGLDVVVGRRDYAGVAYGWALEDTDSFAKVLIERDSGLIAGAHILGPQAATLIQPLIQAMQFRQPAAALARETFYIHPALTEVVENALLDGLAQLERR